MPRVNVVLPSLLASITGAPRFFELEGATFEQILEKLVATHPGVQVHLFGEDRRFRQHVLCYLNETESRRMPRFDVPVAAGDTVRILQAVSGG